MDKTKIGLVGAITSLAAAGAMGAQAAPQPISRAQSYAELLDPIPNAVERLALVNDQSQPDGARLIEAQYIPDGLNDHHHHHHRRHRRHYHHHHHHHHNNY